MKEKPYIFLLTDERNRMFAKLSPFASQLGATPNLSAKPHAKSPKFGSGYEGDGSYYNQDYNNQAGHPYAGSSTTATTDTYVHPAVSQDQVTTAENAAYWANKTAKDTRRSRHTTSKREAAQARVDELAEKERRNATNMANGITPSPNSSSASSKRSTPSPKPLKTMTDIAGKTVNYVKTLARSQSHRNLKVELPSGKAKWVQVKR